MAFDPRSIPPPAYIIIHIYRISTPYTLLFSILFVFSFSFSRVITVYTLRICIFLLRGQPILIFLSP
ncbi:hypothetical protein IW261DRAFT_1439893 [Armillaria novae-zelandiae]|uniref:Uncharacterized protein n=1 Tax=Armillaria novae-zelandiae TaxID=153914 RepID=A0AA39UGK6_9AGAR|nr:hypothetical protein IW261DRAFT_1439893 [Armillaria novae-zelandiae]